MAVPFEDDSIDEFLGSHLVEYLSNRLPFMQELYRVAKPGGTGCLHRSYGSSDKTLSPSVSQTLLEQGVPG